MRYLAIDYGLKRVGLATCDPGETFVSPVCQLEAHPSQPEILIKRLKEVMDEYDAEAIVVGLPLNMDGSEGEQAKLTRAFAQRLSGAIDLEVHLQDERLSSMAADEQLAQREELTKKKRKQRRDMLSACEILNDFLNKERHG